jgi:transcriptional regulator with XRE-family HTH domain
MASIKEIPATLSGRILQALLDRGLNQSKVASMIGAARSHVSRVKSGEYQFTDSQLQRIEKGTATPIWLLLLGSEPSPDASPEVRRIYKEARQLLSKSASIRSSFHKVG